MNPNWNALLRQDPTSGVFEQIDYTREQLHWIGRFAIGGPLSGDEVKGYLLEGKSVYTESARHTLSV